MLEAGNQKKTDDVYISIVIPLLNEEKNVLELYPKIGEVMQKIEREYEIIFIDDGSLDNTFKVIKEFHDNDKRVKLIKFKKNSGKSSALVAGFNYANGRIIITMDGDLQDDPKDIPELLKKIDEGNDMVVGWRYNRKDPFTKKFYSKIFNIITSTIAGISIHDANSGFKAARVEVLKDIKIYGELHRYIPVLVKWKNYNRITEVKVEHRARIHGKSKYGNFRLIKGFLDLLTVKFLISFSERPFHLFGSLGILTLIAGAIIDVYLFYLWLIFIRIGNRPLLFLGVLLPILGVQFISIGLLGELIVNLYYEPTVVDDIIEIS